MTILYGISNCDTVRKARRWLTEHGIEYSFHDLRRDGLDSKMLQAWERQLGWEQMLNRRGTTWRKLPESMRNNINKTAAIHIMQEQPAIISIDDYCSIFSVKDSA
jgi:arsenate reductase